jgi:heme/copper-type cytochrome/quinol oxidase subunit 2
VRRALILIPILLLVLVGLFFLLRPIYSAPESSSGTSPHESTERSQDKTLVDLAIKGSTMTPNEITVNEGDQVRLRITSDEPLEFHLYGYDLDKEIKAGEPSELSIDATTPGRFEIENEQTHEQLGALLVQLRQ